MSKLYYTKWPLYILFIILFNHYVIWYVSLSDDVCHSGLYVINCGDVRIKTHAQIALIKLSLYSLHLTRQQKRCKFTAKTRGSYYEAQNQNFISRRPTDSNSFNTRARETVRYETPFTNLAVTRQILIVTGI